MGQMKTAATTTKTKGAVVRVDLKTISAQQMCMLDHHDSAARVTNSAFYLNHVTVGRPLAPS